MEGVGDLEFVEDDVTGRIEVMGRIGGEERGQGRDGGFESEDKQHVVPYVQVDKSPSGILFQAVADLLPLGSSVGHASVLFLQPVSRQTLPLTLRYYLASMTSSWCYYTDPP